VHQIKSLFVLLNSEKAVGEKFIVTFDLFPQACWRKFALYLEGRFPVSRLIHFRLQSSVVYKNAESGFIKKL
jgi:hypothetical protein